MTVSHKRGESLSRAGDGRAGVRMTQFLCFCFHRIHFDKGILFLYFTLFFCKGEWGGDVN